MRLGLLSDSHGRVEPTRRAVQLLVQHGAELLIHLGDVGSRGVIDELVGHPVRVVFGNCDDADDLGEYARCMDLNVDHPMGRLTIDGRRVAFTHGHLTGSMMEALGEHVDYLLHGHTHELCDQRRGVTRVINPGALHRAARYTAAVLDPGADSLEIIEIPRR